MIDAQLKQLAGWIEEARYAIALTGAGVSTESGIPDFRGADCGLWKMVDPFKVASIDGFFSDTHGFYDFWLWRFAKLSSAAPNITHLSLARLESRGLLKAIITQNIDNLHHLAGTTRLYEVHGNYTRGVCIDCHNKIDTAKILAKVSREKLARCDDCGGLLKPDVVLFGEMLPPAFMDGLKEVLRADLLLVLGSSLEVYPVADLVPQAKQNGARVVVLNREETPFDGSANLVISCELGAAMGRLSELLDLTH